MSNGLLKQSNFAILSNICCIWGSSNWLYNHCDGMTWYFCLRWPSTLVETPPCSPSRGLQSCLNQTHPAVLPRRASRSSRRDTNTIGKSSKNRSLAIGWLCSQPASQQSLTVVTSWWARSSPSTPSGQTLTPSWRSLWSSWRRGGWSWELIQLKWQHWGSISNLGRPAGL